MKGLERRTLLYCNICWPVIAHLCPAPIADHEVEWGGVLGVDEGAVQADGAPARVGHLGLVPEEKKIMCHALSWTSGKYYVIEKTSLTIN